MLEIAYNGRVKVSALEVTSVEGNPILRKKSEPKGKGQGPDRPALHPRNILWVSEPRKVRVFFFENKNSRRAMLLRWASVQEEMLLTTCLFHQMFKDTEQAGGEPKRRNNFVVVAKTVDLT